MPSPTGSTACPASDPGRGAALAIIWLMSLHSTPTVLLVVAASLALSACGGADDDPESAAQEPGTSAEIPGGADPEDVKVIEEWADALREGDIEAAAEHFKLPSTAQNGTPPLRLRSRADVVAFNEALPCGAELTNAENKGRFIVATFELSERPGEGECGPGTGGTAKTAFVIEDGLIVAWVRAADDPLVEPPAEGPVV